MTSSPDRALSAAKQRRYGEYVVIEMIGAGAHGTAYRAVRVSPRGAARKEVCIKVLHDELACDNYFKRAFRTEARVAASMEHPNLVSLIESDPHGCWLAFELVRGVSLRQLLQRQPGNRLSPKLATLVAVDVCKAINYMHAHRDRWQPAGIVHRDISPGNVLISCAGAVKLTDFGVTWDAMREPQTTVKGKSAYMAPEQSRQQPVDGRSDLFSLGVLLYEILAGHRPVQAGSAVDIRSNFEAWNYQPLSVAAPDVPLGLVGIVERLMQPHPDQRFRNARQCLQAFSDFVRHELFLEFDLQLELGQLATQAQPSSEAPDTEFVLRTHRDTVLVDERDNAGMPRVRTFSYSDADESRVARPTVPIAINSEVAISDASEWSNRPAVTAHLETTAHERDPSDRLHITNKHAEEEPVVPLAPARITPAASLPAAHNGARSKFRQCAVAAALLLFIGAAVAWKLEKSGVGAFPEPPRTSALPALDLNHVLSASAQAKDGDHVSTAIPSAASAAAGDTHELAGTLVEAVTPATPVRVPARVNARRSAATAELTVGASPDARVWIDEKDCGWSPVTEKVAAGRHTVAIGDEQPTQSRSIRIRAGEKQDVIF